MEAVAPGTEVPTARIFRRRSLENTGGSFACGDFSRSHGKSGCLLCKSSCKHHLFLHSHFHSYVTNYQRVNLVLTCFEIQNNITCLKNISARADTKLGFLEKSFKAWRLVMQSCEACLLTVSHLYLYL